MLMDLISNDHRNKLCNSGKQQVSMQSLFILGFAAGNTKAVLEMVNGFFNSGPYLIGGIPFICTTERTGVSTQVLLGIDIKHPAAGRSCAGIVTMADTAFGFISFVVFSFHLWAYKLHGRKATAQMGSASFPFHRKSWVFGTARDTIFIQGAV